jgi:hypothetical protein
LMGVLYCRFSLWLGILGGHVLLRVVTVATLKHPSVLGAGAIKDERLRSKHSPYGQVRGGMGGTVQQWQGASITT